MKTTKLHIVLGALFAITSFIFYLNHSYLLQFGGVVEFWPSLVCLVVAYLFFRLATVPMNIHGHLAFLIFGICATVLPFLEILLFLRFISLSFDFALSYGALGSLIFMFGSPLSIFFGFVTIKNQKKV